MEIRVGFKEWSAVCLALGAGRQSILMRRGGIHEPGNAFQPDHAWFLLVPTHWHQTADAIAEKDAHFWRASQSSDRNDEHFAVTHAAKLIEILPIHDSGALHRLVDEHIWTEEVIRERYERNDLNGLFAMVIRVFALSSTVRWTIRPADRGCKSWIERETGPSTAGLVPVLDDDSFNVVHTRIRTALLP
jgi:hypothetical protein